MINTLFFIISKIVWFIISPDSLLFILFMLTMIFYKFNKRVWAKRTFLTGIILFTLIAFLPIGEWIAAPLENRFETNPELPARIDGILVLSGSEDAHRSALWNQPEIHASGERLTAFVTLAKRYPHAKLVHSGGSGSLTLQEFKETDAAGQLYDGLGLDTTRVTFETESRNTFENIRNTKEIVEPKPGENWILITTATHMVRSVGICQKQQWSVIPYPVDHKHKPGHQLRINYDMANNIYTLKSVLREYVGLLSYRAAGKTSSLFPKS